LFRELEGSVVVAKVAEGKAIWHAKPTRVCRYAESHYRSYKSNTCCINAASVAGMILTTECSLIDIKEENAGERFIGGVPE
jgi:chaperonin GroEL